MTTPPSPQATSEIVNEPKPLIVFAFSVVCVAIIAYFLGDNGSIRRSGYAQGLKDGLGACSSSRP